MFFKTCYRLTGFRLLLNKVRMLQSLNHNLLYLYLFLKFMQTKLSLAPTRVDLKFSLRLVNSSFSILKSPLGARQWAQDQVHQRAWLLNYNLYVPSHSVVLDIKNLKNFNMSRVIRFFFFNLPLLSCLSSFLSIKANFFIVY